MKNILFLLLATFIISCNNNDLNFKIEKGVVGRINIETKIEQLDYIFANDSIVKRIGEGDYVFSSSDKYLIFDKKKNHLLTIMPKQQHDPEETIETVQIFSKNFKTAKGINIESSFIDISQNHKISNIQNTINNVIVFVDEIDAYFIIDKKNMDFKFQNETNRKIEIKDIPPKSKVKRLMIGWN